jgi:enterochelin esterase-like enzyme
MYAKAQTKLIIGLLLSLGLGGCMFESEPSSVHHAEVSPSPMSTTSAEQEPLQKSEISQITFHSTALNHDMRMNVYLPKGYSQAQQYPVLYLIHGFSGNETDWISGLTAGNTADQLIAAGEITPLIIAAPEMDNSYGLNSADTYKPGDPNTLYYGMYEDYLYKDVITYIDSHYSALADRGSRWIGGLSMGGFISMHTAFAHPDLFSKAGGHSPALFMDDWSTVGGENGLKPFIYPTNELREQRDPLRMAEKADLSQLSVYLDCGKEDSYKFYEGAGKLSEILKAKGVSVQYHLNPGKHDGGYWQTHVKDYLLFYAGT